MTVFGRGKLKEQIELLKYRVHELEERLCPCGQHDWVRTGERRYYIDYGGKCGCDVQYEYKCKRCEKEKVDIL